MSDLPSPPFIHVEGIHNFRDLGGLPSIPIRPAYIYRSATPARITPAGLEAFKSLGVTTIYDLRSRPELSNDHGFNGNEKAVVEIEGVKRVFAPVFAETDYSPAAIALRFDHYASGDGHGFVRAYREILKHAPPSYTTILEHIRDRPDEPFLIHCTAGKDRTGVLAAIILSLAGAPDEEIAKEYQLTEVGLGEWKRIMTERLTPMLGGDRERADRMVGASEESMLASLDMMRETYGGPEAYVREILGFGEEDVERIRKNLMRPAPV